MKPDAIPSDAEIAWVTFGRIRPVGEHLLKSQDSAIIVFRSGRIRNGNDRDGAGNHDIGGDGGFTCGLTTNIAQRRRPRPVAPQLRAKVEGAPMATAVPVPHRDSLQRADRPTVHGSSFRIWIVTFEGGGLDIH